MEEWKLNVTKSNGVLRRQFLSWAIPKRIRDLLSIQDGMICPVTMQLGEFSYVFKPKVTSGGEFRIPKQVAEEFQTRSAQDLDQQITITIDIDAEEHFKAEVRKSALDSPAKRRRRLKKANKIPKATLTKSISFVFERNPDVVAEVLSQAKGFCGQCGEKAPFIRKFDGKPYLEVHHKIRIADGGEDTVENAIALCPNCHCEEHYG